MAKITVTNDPTVYLRNSKLVSPTHNKMHSVFEEGANKEHKRPLPSVMRTKNETK